MRRVFVGIAAVILSAFAVSATNDPIRLDGDLIQGALVRGAIEPGARVTVGGRAARVSRAGYFVFALGRDAPPEMRLSAVLPDGRRIARTLRVKQRSYRIQHVKGLPPRKVEPSPEDMKRITAEARLINAARNRYTEAAWYRGRFDWPVEGPVTGVYGSQRVLNGKPRRPHLGIDVAASAGTPVVAAADGVVSLARADMFFTGHTVMVDHGQGVSSVYAHLSRLLVKHGQNVRRGQTIGLVGATGRVTGPHLHWGVSVFGTRVDPMLLTGPMPKRPG